MSKLELVTDLPTENSIKNSIITYLVQRGALVIRVNSGAVTGTYQGKRRFFWFIKWYLAGAKEQHGGVSDILALLPPPNCRYIAIETKRPGNTTTEAQRRFLAEWQAHGGIAIIASSLDDVLSKLQTIGVLQ